MTRLAALRDAAGSLLARPSVRWIVLALVAAAVLGTAVYSYRQIDRELTAVALSRRGTVAQLTATVLAEKFGRLVDVAVSLATRVRFRELVERGKWTEAIEIMRAVPRDLPHIERLFLTDAAGTLRADTPALPDVRGKNFASHEWFQGVRRDWRPYVSPVYTRVAAPRINVFAVAAPIRNATGAVAGILVLHIRVESLLEWIEAVDTEPGGFIYIVDSRGRLAFHSKYPDRKEIVDLSAVPVVQRLRRGRHEVEIGYDPVEGEDAIVAHAAVPGYGWGVVTQQPVRASLGLAARDAQRRQLLAGYGVILTLGAAATYLASRVGRERLRAEKRFHAVTETANDAVVSADHDGNVVYFNPAAERIFGYSAAEALGRPLTLLMPERFHSAYRDGLRRFLAGGETHVVGKTVELAGRRRDGAEFPVELSLASWKAGEEMFFTGIMRDISARKAAEEALRNNTAQLEAANKELEAFSYSVSHDLRAPLRSIDGFSQALLEDYPDRLDDQGRHYLTRVRAATQRMAELIDDMLQLSRVTRAEMHRETVDLNALAGSLVDDLRRAEPGRRVEVVIQPGLTAEGDPALLRVVLSNLLANAWKFTGKQPVARIELGGRDSGDERAFYVRDNGVGFDMAYAGKLFGAFQRLHAMSEFPGTGIGLATVQRIVHRHGGRVWAEATVNRGATFYFALPINRTA